MVETTPVTKGEKIKEEWGDAVHEDLRNIAKETADYVVFKEDGTVKARNGETGEIDYSGTDAATVIQNAIDDLDSAGGGHIYVKNGDYGGASVTLKGNVSFTIAPNVLNLSYSKGTNFSANIIDQSGKVDVGQAVLKDTEGNLFAKIEDTADGGIITLYNEAGTPSGEIKISSPDRLVFNALENDLGFRRMGIAKMFFKSGQAKFYDKMTLEGNPLVNVTYHSLTAQDSVPASPVNQAIYLASPTWDPDGDGNGEYVVTDDGGTTWHEIVDLPNYT